jgi:hypothetical protein
MNNEGKPLHFTYFINGAYFLTKDEAGFYNAPREKSGFSNIGFGDSHSDIVSRVRGFNEALKEGNEIGSHSVGHFSGNDWSYEEWKKEFGFFSDILFDRGFGNPPNFPEKFSVTKNNLVGFRAPNLAVNENLYKALGDFGFKYDASGINIDNSWPKKDGNGVWRVPLGIVEIGQRKKPTVAMDYSIWETQSGAKELARKGTPLWDKYLSEVENAYMDYFNRNYKDGRAPISIGNHFSKWNDGVYFEALKNMAEKVCGLSNVRCTTHKDLVDYLDIYGAPAITKQN